MQKDAIAERATVWSLCLPHTPLCPQVLNVSVCPSLRFKPRDMRNVAPAHAQIGAHFLFHYLAFAPSCAALLCADEIQKRTNVLQAATSSNNNAMRLRPVRPRRKRRNIPALRATIHNAHRMLPYRSGVPVRSFFFHRAADAANLWQRRPQLQSSLLSCSYRTNDRCGKQQGCTRSIAASSPETSGGPVSTVQDQETRLRRVPSFRWHRR